ncbi:SNF2 family N-terminal domain-containing protein [Fomitopsis serialis]|uniref:SNF2 family N-terminal domain-containing protein n=1 Tax=Fomitopsis serialis TaxID=139415 RepID=UPI0020072E18|nr:SNF2 family N-terminal domain-containing protein [Neoantrodia serialis]KAH9921336.1 SNF2 family N-terminal domain-containing protein [Neoantrodia serialis]
MAAPNVVNPQLTNGQPYLNGNRQAPRPQFTREQIQGLVRRAHLLKEQGATVETSAEYAKIYHFLQQIQQPQPQNTNIPDHNQPGLNGHASTSGLTNGNALPNGNSLTNGTASAQPYPQAPSTPVSFTPEQIEALRAQIQAFKMLMRNKPVPEAIQQAMRLPNQVVPDLQKLLQSGGVDARVIDSAVKVHKSATPGVMDATLTEPIVEEIKAEDMDLSGADVPKGPFLEDDVNSGIYPYNAYQHPFDHLLLDSDAPLTQWATRLQRLLIPTLMPTGLDPHQVISERNRYVDARIEQRIRELEELPATMGDGGMESVADDIIREEKENSAGGDELAHLAHPSPNAQGKLRALIELKGLRVLDKQRQMRALVAERLTHGSMLPLNRADFRRTRKPTIRDARMTEQLERKQRVDRERRAKQKHVEQLSVICAHGREVVAASRSAQDRIVRLGKAVLSLHSHTEKEEQKRIERISKERLKALKADDEEAYMKLIDTAKDTRITHLLRQTDTYLDSLTQAVMEQQEDVPLPDVGSSMYEDDPTSEATFGAQKFDNEGEDKGKLDYYAVAHRLKERITKQPAMLIGGTLKDYQLKGLQWMVSLYNNKLNGILADEMGLGKTIQTISLITYLIETKKQRGPYLVIVPLSTMTNWSGEFAKWAPNVKMISYKGNPTQRKALQGDLRTGNFQVLLTTYEYIIKDRVHLARMRWVHMIIDEGHRMKNTQSKLAQTLTQYYHSRYRLILTGTPLQNNLPELWALLNFVLPKIFNSVKSFDEWFNTPFANSGTGDKIELNEEEALLIIRRLHKVLRPFLLRRLKKDVESELPDKVEKVIKIRMSALQSQLYKQMKKYKMIADGKDTKGKNGGVKGLSNELMQLRKICQHPFLFESVEDRVNPSGIINETLIRSSGKIELLSRILPKFFATDHRVLIFFQMTKVMDIMEDFLKYMGWKYLRLDGGTKTEDRAGHVAQFNAPNSDIRVFILSTRAGGLGLNLQTADTVIMQVLSGVFDSDWNPHADLQAQDRAHRIGQTKVVRILRFITEKSVEEAMFARARYKLDIDDKVIQAGRFDNKSTQEEQEEFLRSILEADQEEENEEAGDMNDDEINEIISRSEDEDRIFREIDIQRDREALENWRAAGKRGKPPQPLMQLDELPDCYKSDEPFDNKDEIDEVEGRGHRRRNIVNYTDGLSDDQWAMALEDGEDLQELADRTRERKASRAATKNIRDLDVGSPAMDDTPRVRKGRKGKGKADGDVTPASNKRKRGAKAMSVTPSIQDDEEEERDTKRRKTKVPDVPPAVRDKMKKAFNEIYKAVLNCEDSEHRRRCELFREVPDRREYPDYYQLIKQPIALSTLRKRLQSNYYKTVTHFREDWKLMFNNARTYNQEGSWVYVDAEEMEKVFNAQYDRLILGSGLPGAPPAANGSSSAYESALTPMDEDERLPPKGKSTRKQVLSDDEYLTNPSDDE